MRTVHDKNLVPAYTNEWGTKREAAGGHVLIGTSFVEYLDKTIEGNRKPAFYKIVRESDININYPGRQAAGDWSAVKALLSQPWKEAVSLVDRFIEEVSKAPMPEPHSIKRKMRWNDDEGEIDVPRAMDGENEMYRKGFRRKIKGPSNVVLLANLDKPGCCNSSGVFYRSIACIVLADILESKGYGVEIWAWCAGGSVFSGKDQYQFNALQVKKSDQPLDKDTLCNVLSAWFTHYVIWASWNANPTPPKSLGFYMYGNPMNEEGYYDPKNQRKELQGMFSHIQPEDNTAQVYLIPELTVYDYSTKVYNYKTGKYEHKGAVINKKACALIVQTCKDILTEIIRRESEAA